KIVEKLFKPWKKQCKECQNFYLGLQGVYGKDDILILEEISCPFCKEARYWEQHCIFCEREKTTESGEKLYCSVMCNNCFRHRPETSHFASRNSFRNVQM